MNTYYKILNEIASVFNIDQWDEQVNLFTDIINAQLNPFIHHTKKDWIFILENSSFHHDFPQFDFYKERCYVNGEKVKLFSVTGRTENKWKDRETINVIIKDLDQLEFCNFMFFKCYSLVSVPLFDTSRVKNMKGMFYECESLKSVPLFDTRSVIDMYCMFYNCPFLSKETKKDWSSVYNFKTDKKRRTVML